MPLNNLALNQAKSSFAPTGGSVGYSVNTKPPAAPMRGFGIEELARKAAQRQGPGFGAPPVPMTSQLPGAAPAEDTFSREQQERKAQADQAITATQAAQQMPMQYGQAQQVRAGEYPTTQLPGMTITQAQPAAVSLPGMDISTAQAADVLSAGLPAGMTTPMQAPAQVPMGSYLDQLVAGMPGLQGRTDAETLAAGLPAEMTSLVGGGPPPGYVAGGESNIEPSDGLKYNSVTGELLGGYVDGEWHNAEEIRSMMMAGQAMVGEGFVPKTPVTAEPIFDENGNIVGTYDPSTGQTVHEGVMGTGAAPVENLADNVLRELLAGEGKLSGEDMEAQKKNIWRDVMEGAGKQTAMFAGMGGSGVSGMALSGLGDIWGKGVKAATDLEFQNEKFGLQNKIAAMDKALAMEHDEDMVAARKEAQMELMILSKDDPNAAYTMATQMMTLVGAVQMDAKGLAALQEAVNGLTPFSDEWLDAVISVVGDYGVDTAKIKAENKALRAAIKAQEKDKPLKPGDIGYGQKGSF